MTNKSFTTTIEVEKPASVVFNCIKEVTNWWNKEDFEGNSSNPGDEFIINHSGQHYSKQKLVEVIPNKKIVWLVTESNLPWLKKEKHEWTNTKMIFEINAKDNMTTLHFTHEGLTPEKECFDMCGKGWTIVIRDWLIYFIIHGKATNELTRAAEIRNKHLKNELL